MITYEQFETLCFLDYPPWEINKTWDVQLYDSRILRYIEFNDGKVLTFENWGNLYLGEMRYRRDWKGPKFYEVPYTWMKEILKNPLFWNNLCRWKVFKPIWLEIKNERR